MINSLLITRRSKYDLFHILFVIKTPLRGRKDPLKFASLPTCGFVAQLVERPTSIREARVQAPSKPEFFSGFFFCNFFNCSLPAMINSLLIILIVVLNCSTQLVIASRRSRNKSSHVQIFFFNFSWRRETIFVGLCSRSSLSRVRLTRVCLTRVRLTRVRLTRVRLTRVRLTRVRLTRVLAEPSQFLNCIHYSDGILMEKRPIHF